MQRLSRRCASGYWASELHLLTELLVFVQSPLLKSEDFTTFMTTRIDIPVCGLSEAFVTNIDHSNQSNDIESAQHFKP